jgi:hypothetical protein
LCYYDDEASLDLKYRELNGGSSEFGSENPAVVGLIRHIETWMGTLDDAERERWVQYLNKTADVFLVFNDGEQEGGNSEVSFTHFQPVDSLVGSHVEAYARRIGDIDDEEWEARKAEDENNVDLQFRKEEVTAAVDDHVDLGTEESVDGEDEEMEGESGDEYEENEADKTLTGCI